VLLPQFHPCNFAPSSHDRPQPQGTDIKQVFSIRAGNSIPVEAEITGKLTLSLEFNSATSMQKKAKGFTMYVDRNWEQVKPDKVNFEREVHEKMCGILESETSRVEFVGTGQVPCACL